MFTVEIWGLKVKLYRMLCFFFLINKFVLLEMRNDVVGNGYQFFSVKGLIAPICLQFGILFLAALSTYCYLDGLYEIIDVTLLSCKYISEMPKIWIISFQVPSFTCLTCCLDCLLFLFLKQSLASTNSGIGLFFCVM